MSSSTPVVRDFSSIDDPAVFIEDTFDSATLRGMEGLSPSALVMLSPQRMTADASNDENDDPTCGGYHVYSSKRKSGLGMLGEMSTPNQKRTPLGSRRLSTSQKRHPTSLTDAATPENISINNRAPSQGSMGRHPHGLASASKSRAFGTVLTLNHHSHVVTKIDAKLFDTPRKGDTTIVDTHALEETEIDMEEVLEATMGPADSLARHFLAEEVSSNAAARTITEEELLDHYVPLEEYEKAIKERDRYREMYRYQSSMCDDYYQREREAQEKLQEKIRELIAVSSRNEESKRFIRQMKREMLDCRERTLPFLNKRLEDDRREKEIKDKFARQLQIEEETFEREEQRMKEENAALEALLKDLRKVCGLGKSPESLLKASYQKNIHLYGELCLTRKQLDSELERRAHLEKLNEILRKEKREAESGTSRERRRHFAREDTLIREAHELQDEIVRLRQKLIDRTSAEGGINITDDYDEEDEGEGIEYEAILDEDVSEQDHDASFAMEQEEEEEEQPEPPVRRSERLSPPSAQPGTVKSLFPLEDLTAKYRSPRNAARD